MYGAIVTAHRKRRWLTTAVEREGENEAEDEYGAGDEAPGHEDRGDPEGVPEVAVLEQVDVVVEPHKRLRLTDPLGPEEGSSRRCTGPGSRG
ncbi:hypothetical protein [Phytohabitans suffuscus]|nr:hypothetical protein [Phytohabitans suffuscus]